MPSQADIDAYNALVDTVRANAGYESADDAAMAAAFSDALREMIALYPSRAQSGGGVGEFLQFDRETQLELLKKAEDFVKNKERAQGNGATLYWKMCGRSV